MGGWLALGENYFLGEVFLDLKTIYTFLGVSRAVSCVQFESCALTVDLVEEVTVQYLDGTKLGDKDLVPGLAVLRGEGVEKGKVVEA